MAAESKLSLKLLVDTKGHKVVYGEAGKEFVDFLFHILSMPIATVVKILEQGGMAGCLADLHNSLRTLSPDYLLEKFYDQNSPSMKILYTCVNTYDHNYYYTDIQGTKCPSCGGKMSCDIRYVGPTSSGDIKSAWINNNVGGGFVKGVATYMVMDNLEVKPLSTTFIITDLFNKFNVKDSASLVLKEVQVGLNEGVAMLKASLETKDVLTAVFLGKKI